MKKKMLSLVLTGVLAVSLLAGCGGSGDDAASTDSTDAATEEDAAADADDAAAADTASGEGSVYYLNFKPEQDQQWQDLAALYTEQTGVPVTVVTAASGTYETTLMSEMGKSSAPTLFQVNGPVGLANWKDYCYDLSGTDIYNELTSDTYALKDGDKVAGIGYVIDSRLTLQTFRFILNIRTRESTAQTPLREPTSTIIGQCGICISTTAPAIRQSFPLRRQTILPMNS